MRPSVFPALGLCLAVLLGASASRAQTVRDDFYITNGQVNTQLILGTKLYVGGSFSSVGAVTGSGVPVDAETGVAVAGFPRIDGQITVAIPDGAGGWFLGGAFTKVGAASRSNLAHVLADYSVDPWAPNPNGQVRALVVSGDTLHVGGDFTTIGAASRNRIAAISVATGGAMPWNPNANGSVRALLKRGSTLYVGGSFTSIAGQTRNRVAAISVTSGLLTSFNPNSNSQVSALSLAGDTLYAGGQFTAIGSASRNRIAAVSLGTGVAFGWNPNANNQVLAMSLVGGKLYAGGQFTTVGGQTRNRIAAIDVVTGLASSWNPNANNTVQAMVLSGDTLFAGGDFTIVGGQSRSRVAALSTATGLAMSWNPTAFGSVTALARENGVVLVGGLFNAVGGARRNNLAAFDVTSGEVLDWDPNANFPVLALEASADALIVGGSFTQIGGQIRNGLAAIDFSNGLATAWDPNTGGSISALALSGNIVYAGGLFASIGGQTRSNLAAIDLTTGMANSWNPNADNQVLVIEPNDSTLYVGGSFSVVGGAPRDFLAALSPTTGGATGWNPAPTGTVRTIVASCDRVLVGGFFSSVGGQPRNQLASLSPESGLADSWNPDPNGPVFSIAWGTGVIYVGGVLGTIGGQSRNRIASVDPTSGLATSWNPNANGTVRSILAHGGMVYAGGSFTVMGTTPSGNLAVMSADTSLPCATIALALPPAPSGVVGTPYSFTATASGGTGPYCFAVSAGSLPPGISLAQGTGALSGTPSAAGVHVFTLTATDRKGCSGSETYTLTVNGSPVTSLVTPDGAGDCLTPSQPCVTVPFMFSRGDSVPLRAISVTFNIANSKLALCAAGPPSASIRPGTWLAAFPNNNFQVTSLGGGNYTVDQVLLGLPCGVTTGGELFVVDLKSLGIDGAAAITVTSVSARDCDNAPIGVNPGPATSVNILGTPIALLPASLSGGLAGSTFSQTLTTSAGTAPFLYTLSSGQLPPDLTLAPSGLLSGTLSTSGTFNFTVTATDAGGCAGSRTYSITVTCPTLAITPSLLPDGAVGIPYSQTFSTVPGLSPFTYAVTAGSVPAGLTLSSGGILSGTPAEAGGSVFTVGVTDAAGCNATADHVVSIFATAPSSTVAANTAGLCISSANPCVTVPIVYTRDESAPVRAMSITFQLDPAKLALCTPNNPDSSVHKGTLFTNQSASTLQIVDLGNGAYRADITSLGAPCGITVGGTAITLDLRSVAGDGFGTITVTAVRSRDCDNAGVPVMAGPQAQLRILNTPIVILPPTLPNALSGESYSHALGTDSGLAPFTFAISAGALPSGLTLSPAGLISGTPVATGTFGFTVSVADAGGAPGSRSYSLTVSCQPIAVKPSALPTGAVGTAYSEVFAASAGASPFTWGVSAGSLPSGLSLSAVTGEISGTPSTPSTGVFTITATDAAGCTGAEDYTLTVFADPGSSTVSASTTGLCLSALQPCVDVPFLFAQGESAPVRGISVTFQLDTTKLALCTPGTPASSIRIGSWLAGYVNRSLMVSDLGAGAYRVDLVLLGAPCGPTMGGEVFGVNLQSIGPDGNGTISVTAVQVRDCENVPLPGVPGAVASLAINHTAPLPITALASSPINSGNAPGSTTGIALTWENQAAGIVSLYRAPFGTYPRYDEPGPVSTPDASAAPGAPWAVVSTNAVTGHVDHPPTRGFWYYVAFVTDSCGNRSLVSNLTTGSLNYHLGDVSDGATQSVGDNRVSPPDVSLLGAHYGITGAAILSAGVSYLDVGPTTDGLVTSRPVTDQAIEFEDLMVFSSNYQVVSAPANRAMPAVAGTLVATTEHFEVIAPSLVEPGAEVTAHLRLSASGNLRGFSAQLAWDATVVEPVSTTSVQFVESQGGIVLSPRHGKVDAALLGARDVGLTGAGEVASFGFRVLREGDAAIRLERILARDGDNRPFAPEAVGRATIAQVPARTLLLAPWPNPSPVAATLAFALAERGPVELAIFSVDGRRVRTLTRGHLEAGVHRATWAGEDEARHPVAPGVYFVRLTAGGREWTRRLVHLR